jgi:uncharacterized membrane protein YbhN (UPF0104 family)
MPSAALTRRQIAFFASFVLATAAFMYLVLPRLAGVGETIHSLQNANLAWLGVAVVLEICSFAGYVVLFRTVFARESPRINLVTSYQIALAGLAATRLFAAAGAGGIALTAWALRRAGLGRRVVAARILTFLVLLYFLFGAAVIVCGAGLWSGVLGGGGPALLTLIPALVAVAAFALTAAATLVPGDLERRLAHLSAGAGRSAPWIARIVAVPPLAAGGVRSAWRLVRIREFGVLGAAAWWAFDIAVLWASFKAFNAPPPPPAVLAMAYFVGMLGNLLPLPGGLGGVEGGMIGALVAFGTPLSSALVAVLAYRAISFWLPTIPGVIAYIHLRRTVGRWRAQEQVPRSGRFRRPAPCYTIQSEVKAIQAPESSPAGVSTDIAA